MKRSPGLRAGVIFIFVIITAIFAGCSTAETKSQPASAGAAPSPTVQVAQVEQRDITLTSEWIGSMDGYVNGQIQPHVSGYLTKQNYREGSAVHKGEVLFEIDARPFQVALDQSRAQLAQAQAQLLQSQSQVTQTQAVISQAKAQLAKIEQDIKRDTPLAEAKAIAQSKLDDDLQARSGAEAAVAAAQAQSAASQSGVVAAQSAVQAAKAAVDQAELNLSYTKITSLVDGIAGIAKAQIGDLVATTTVLTSVSQLDPIKVYFPISEQDYLRAQKIKPGAASATPLDGIPLTLVLADGSIYPRTGKVLWVDRQIDTGTGTIRVVSEFPNPGNILRPGQYGKIRATTESRRNALLVPQSGVVELQGNYQVVVVTAGNKVEIHPIKVDAPFEGSWIVREGVAAGDRIVVGGMQYAQPGATVNPVSAGATAKDH
jgi:membrane fusion protein (multidrug efflux system)